MKDIKEHIPSIEVFKTNVQREEEAIHIVRKLNKVLPAAEISFDLEDCDRVLRVTASSHYICRVPELVKEIGFECEPLT